MSTEKENEGWFEFLPQMYRLKVINGWLVKTVDIVGTVGSIYNVVFVPDANHYWEKGVKKCRTLIK